MKTERAVETACPLCREPLDQETSAWNCRGCGERFPVIAGIPDLRVEPDPWIGIEEDREKALRVEEEIKGLDFAQAVRRYWEMTPTTPPEVARRFIDHVLGAEARSREWLDRTGLSRPPRSGQLWLDVGTGTADLAASAPGGVHVVGLDVALRWLVVARRRLEERGAQATLICGNAERLPFRDQTFDRVLTLGTLEHCRDAGKVLQECRRVLVSGGEMRLRTVNRFTLLPEPHVGLRGVGLLPRRWADPYVRLRSGRRYLHHRPLGPRELRRGMREAGFQGVEVEAAVPLEAEVRRLGPLGRRLAGAYGWTRRLPVLASLIRAVAPVLEGGGRVP